METKIFCSDNSTPRGRLFECSKVVCKIHANISVVMHLHIKQHNKFDLVAWAIKHEKASRGPL